MKEPGIIYTATEWPTNSHLIADCERLGYLDANWLTLDVTYGLGNFWNVFRPNHLIGMDKYTSADVRADCTALPFPDATFKVVVEDFPYKLNGTSYEKSDVRYGVDKPAIWQQRLQLMQLGMREGARVLARKGFLLFKCQDQVAWSKKRWQTDMFSNEGYDLGLEKVDRFDFLNDPRSQGDRVQRRSRANYSTLLIFQKLR